MKDNSGGVIKAKLARQNRSIKWLALMTRMSPSTLSYKIRTPSAMTLGDARRIDAVLHLSTEEWMEWTKGGKPNAYY